MSLIYEVVQKEIVECSWTKNTRNSFCTILHPNVPQSIRKLEKHDQKIKFADFVK